MAENLWFNITTSVAERGDLGDPLLTHAVCLRRLSLFLRKERAGTDCATSHAASSSREPCSSGKHPSTNLTKGSS